MDKDLCDDIARAVTYIGQVKEAIAKIDEVIEKLLKRIDDLENEMDLIKEGDERVGEDSEKH